MEKTEIIQTTKTITRTFCDDCSKEKEIKHTLSCCRAQCEFCKKELCEECVAHERGTYGDYREVYCKTCSIIYKKYQPELKRASVEYRAILTAMRKECVESRKE